MTTNGNTPDTTHDEIVTMLTEVAIEDLEALLAKYQKHRHIPEFDHKLGPILDAIEDGLKNMKET